MIPLGICMALCACFQEERQDASVSRMKYSHSLKGDVFLSTVVEPALSHSSNVVSRFCSKSLSTYLISTVTKQIISPSPVHLSFLIHKMVTTYKPRKAEWYNDHVWQSVGNCEWGISASHHQHDEQSRYTESCFQSTAMVSFSSQKQSCFKSKQGRETGSTWDFFL